MISFWFKYHLRQKYHAPQIWSDCGSNSWPPDRDGTFQVTETSALTIRPSVTLFMMRFVWSRHNSCMTIGYIRSSGFVLLTCNITRERHFWIHYLAQNPHCFKFVLTIQIHKYFALVYNMERSYLTIWLRLVRSLFQSSWQLFTTYCELLLKDHYHR